LIELMTVAGAKIVKLNKGTLAIGADADVTVIDPNLKWKIDKSTFRGKSRNCPFDGWEVTGKATHAIVAGRVMQ
jgi:dihydroorotase